MSGVEWGKIRRLLQRITYHYSVIEIIASLHELKIPSPTGKEKWSKRSIEVMLNNKKYTGDIVILKKYADNAKPAASDSHSTYLATASHPAIISHEQFSEVQTEHARRSNIVVNETGSHGKNNKYSSKKAVQVGGESDGTDYFINRNNYSFQPYPGSDGLSGKKQSASPKSGKDASFIIKNRSRNCACNEFISLCLAAMLGVNIPNAYLVAPKKAHMR